MKKLLCMALCLALLSGCAAPAAPTTEPRANEVQITLSDGGVEFPADCGVHTANDIVYYEAGHDETYGEGDESEAHTPEEAAAHTVVHITQPGTYRISGKLSAGQIAVDLGEDAAGNHKKVVTLILDNADITCRVAPAVIFYNVYECGNPDDPQADVDTAPAGANVILAPGSINNIVGSHVAKIYKPETVIDGKKVFDVADGFLLACFDTGVTTETVTAIAKRKPYYAVFRDSSMADDSTATNFDQIFETYSHNTVRKVL